LGGEAHKPFISVPRALTWTPILTGVLYLFSAMVQDVALRDMPSNGALSATPLSDLMSEGAPAIAAVLDLGIAVSWLACAIASVTALARVLFCMGREGIVPRVFGRAHPRFRTPWMAIVMVVPVVALVPVLLLVSGVSPEQGLANLFMLGAYGHLGAYILTSASLPFFLRRIGEDTFVSWILGAGVALAIGAVLWGSATVRVRAGDLQVLVYGMVLLVSVIHGLFLQMRQPGRLAGVGIYDETRELDLFKGGSTR
jgi:amino acid transporter